MLRAHLVLAIPALWLLAAPAEAAKLKVPADYPTIQAAVDAALPGDVVQISKGTYVETVEVIGKDDLVIKGKKGDKVVIDAGGVGLPVEVAGCTSVELRNLRLQGSTGAAGIVIGFSTLIRVTDCVVKDVDQEGVLVGFSECVEIVDCTITDVGTHGIKLEIAVSGCLVQGNKVKNVGAVGIYVTGEEHTIRDNLIRKPGTDGILLGEASPCVSTLVLGNELEDIPDQAIEVSSSVTGGSIMENRVDTASEGLLILGATYLTVVGNVFQGVTDDGIQTGGSYGVYYDNKVKKAGNDAFYVTGQENLFTENVSKKAVEDGFHVNGSDNSFTQNTAKKSGSFDLRDAQAPFTNLYVDNAFEIIGP